MLGFYIYFHCLVRSVFLAVWSFEYNYSEILI